MKIFIGNQTTAGICANISTTCPEIYVNPKIIELHARLYVEQMELQVYMFVFCRKIVYVELVR